ncbi:MAG: S41 family peptidase [Opitutaceae bacterium]|nr:S41 family peptidase [Opitutaceae bacterium]
MSWWRKFRRSWTSVVLLAALLVQGCAVLPGKRVPAEPASSELRLERNQAVFGRTVELVDRHFFDANFGGRDWKGIVEAERAKVLSSITSQELYQALNEMLGKLEVSHLYAFSPELARENELRKRARIGVHWRTFNGQLVVERVVPGSPASEAGVEPGWIALEVEGKPVLDTLPLRLSEGQSVTIAFLDRQDQRRELLMTARILSLDTPPQERVLPDGIVYLRFDSFTRDTRRWLSDALKRHARAPAVVLDLRNNSGGQLFSLNIVVGELFPNRVPVGTWVWRGGRSSPGRGSQWLAARYNGPLAVLVDDSTYSAAEILSHVVQHHGRARLYGRKTGGAVIAAQTFRLPDGGKLDIPMIDYVGLDGRRLEKNGVEPDVPVGRSLAAIREGRDLDLEAALASLRK